MSVRFGSGWLVTYFLICSCTFKCSAPQLRARDCTTFNPFEPLPFSVTPDTRFWVTFSPLQGRAALTVEVTRPRGRPASRCWVAAFQNSQRLEMCGAPRSGQRGWSTCTPSRIHIPDVLSATLPLQDWGRVARDSGAIAEEKLPPLFALPFPLRKPNLSFVGDPPIGRLAHLLEHAGGCVWID